MDVMALTLLVLVASCLLGTSRAFECYSCSSETDSKCGNVVGVLMSKKETCGNLVNTCEVFKWKNPAGTEIIERRCSAIAIGINQGTCEAGLLMEKAKRSSSWVSGACCSSSSLCNSARSLAFSSSAFLITAVLMAKLSLF
ncbi:uncharacterized protein LOC141912746 [Tubulanus polymorphus]|uniref:uncharacterized protein LOC141912746 n=1 Tax=Tubulanus polymorphus TaxID=672921 RepID=UPI003DA34D2B